MNRRAFLSSAVAGAVLPWSQALGQGGQQPAEAVVTIRPERELGRVTPFLYGHFLEHLEDVIYGGVFEPKSRRSNRTGIRMDVVEAIREMGGAHVVRWPGGNFVSGYHWENGVGPRSKRRRHLDLAFDQYDNNHFGTDEYLEFCRLVEAEPFITANMGSGTVEEACRWVGYTRREKRQPPVRIWGLGNEHFGPWQLGHYTGEEYARMAAQYARFMRVVSPDLRYVGVGHLRADWNDAVLRGIGDDLEWLSIHLYGHRDFLTGVDDFDTTVFTPARFEREIEVMGDQIDAWEPKSKRKAPLGIVLEEWNTRHRRQGGQLWRRSPRNIVDALFTASVYNTCLRQSRRVTMTNFIFLVNSHAPIVVEGDQVVRTATFDVFRLYATRGQPVAVQAEVSDERFTADPYRVGDEAGDLATPLLTTRLDAAVTSSTDGRRTTAFLVNRRKDRSVRVRLDGLGPAVPSQAVVDMLVADSLTATNSVTEPQRVRSRRQDGVNWRDGILLPPASFAAVQI